MFFYIFWGVDIPCTAIILCGCIIIFCTHNKWTCTDTKKVNTIYKTNQTNLVSKDGRLKVEVIAITKLPLPSTLPSYHYIL